MELQSIGKSGSPQAPGVPASTQSLGQVVALSLAEHFRSPQNPQSARHVVSSLGAHVPSPHLGVQSFGQPSEVSQGSHVPSPQALPQSLGQVAADSWGEAHLPSPQALGVPWHAPPTQVMPGGQQPPAHNTPQPPSGTLAHCPTRLQK